MSKLDNFLGNVRCPCKVNCIEKREQAANVVINKGICSANEIKEALSKAGIGKSVQRKSIKFLQEGKCKKVLTVGGGTSNKIVFRNQGQIFYLKGTSEKAILEKKRSCIPLLQRSIIEKLENQDKKIYYFTNYEIKKLLAYQASFIDYSLKRLEKLGLIKSVEKEKIFFYCLPSKYTKLVSNLDELVYVDKTEFLTTQKIHELVMHFYPKMMIMDYRGALRPRTSEVLRKTGGMTFDIFYELQNPILEKKYIVLDLYSRIPLNGFIVNTFIKKIEWSRNLKNRAFGIIIYRDIKSRKALTIANNNKILCTHLDELHI